jgi:hypothetical protein
MGSYDRGGVSGASIKHIIKKTLNEFKGGTLIKVFYRSPGNTP